MVTLDWFDNVQLVPSHGRVQCLEQKDAKQILVIKSTLCRKEREPDGFECLSSLLASLSRLPLDWFDIVHLRHSLCSWAPHIGWGDNGPLTWLQAIRNVRIL